MKAREGFVIVNGKELPRVTHILKIVSSGEALLNWVKKLIFEYITKFIGGGQTINTKNLSYILETLDNLNKQILKDAGFLGTDFHNILESLGKGEKIDEGLFHDPRMKGWVGEFEKWYKENIKTIISTETPINTDRYTGTLDALVEMKNGDIAVLDYKTSKYIYDTHHLQVAAYVNAYENMHNIKINTAFILRFEKGDKKPLMEVQEVKDLAYQYEVFMKTLDVWEWKTNRKERQNADGNK